MKIKITRNKITNEANKHLQIVIAQREIIIRIIRRTSNIGIIV